MVRRALILLGVALVTGCQVHFTAWPPGVTVSKSQAGGAIGAKSKPANVQGRRDNVRWVDMTTGRSTICPVGSPIELGAIKQMPRCMVEICKDPNTGADIAWRVPAGVAC